MRSTLDRVHYKPQNRHRFPSRHRQKCPAYVGSMKPLATSKWLTFSVVEHLTELKNKKFEINKFN